MPCTYKHNPSETGRKQFIDIAKGIGIFIVIASHVYSPIIRWALPCYVPLFFVTSGYCTCHPIHIKKKFRNLIIPYVFFTCILFCLHRMLTIEDIAGAVYSRWCLYPIGTSDNVFFLQAYNGPLWFLTSMFSSSVLLGAILKSVHKWLFVLLYILIAYACTSLPILLPWSIDTAPLTAVIMMSGIFIRRNDILSKLHRPLLLFALMAVYAALCNYCDDVNFSVRKYGTSIWIALPAAITGSILIMKASQFLESTPLAASLSKIGRMSLSLFCLHFPFIYFWRKVLNYIDSISQFPELFHILTFVLVFVTVYPISLILQPLLTKFIHLHEPQP